MALRNGVVLVVEDHLLVRMAFLAVLTAAGFEALEASNATEAHKSLRLGRISALCSQTRDRPERWMGSNWSITSETGGGNIDRRVRQEGDLLGGASRGNEVFHKPYRETAILEAMAGMLSGGP